MPPASDDLTFDELIPKGKPPASAAPAASSSGDLTFDDLLPQKKEDGASFAERFDAAPSQTVAGGIFDFLRSVPGGISRGVANTLSASGQSAQAEMGQPIDVPNSQETQKVIEGFTGPQYQPQGLPGRIGQSIGEAAGNPTSYVGPGSPGLKLGGAALAGAGGQLGEETGIPGGRVVGSVLGGVAAGKTLGPTGFKAETPNYAQVKAAATQNYRDALKSGLEINPQSFANDFALGAEQKLQAAGFSPDGQVYRRIQSIQADAAKGPVAVTAQNLDSIRKFLGRQARETSEGKPTENAAAAATVLDHYNNYLENIPPSSVMAGDPAAYLGATREGNANYAAAQRMRAFDQKIMAAETASSGGKATDLENQIKSKTRQLIDRGQYVDIGEKRIPGYTPEEQAQAELINSGNWWSNLLRQPGRLATGVLPAMFHTGLATHTGGASIPLQIIAEGLLYGAKRGSQQATISRAETLANMLAQRSPLYQQRVNALPPAPSSLPNWAAPIRGGLLGFQR